jgi:cysteine-rich repeat protein
MHRSLLGLLFGVVVACEPHNGEDCTNGLDDNLDGAVDCVDSSCSFDSSCQFEAECESEGCEVEPNDTAADANDFFALAGQDQEILARSSASDLDIYRFEIPSGQGGSLHAETSVGPFSAGSCNFQTISLTFLDEASQPLAVSVGTCGTLDLLSLPSGVYFLEVRAPGVSDYLLRAQLDLFVCGDGTTAPGEACDDGNTIAGDGCRADCFGIEVCGDGLLDPAEQCEDSNNSNNDDCPGTCQSAACGDGFVEFGAEECDDGNNQSGDGCNAGCSLEIPSDTEPNNSVAQADGIFRPEVILSGELDSSLDVDVYAFQLLSTSSLIFETEPFGEQLCFSGSVALDVLSPSGVPLDNGCALLSANNRPALRRLPPGIYTVAAKPVGAVATSYQLHIGLLSSCGDGLLSDFEACDDGNLLEGDGCSAACEIECSDGRIEPGESCDDGNLFSGDGCDAQCQLESGFVSEQEPNNTADTATPISDIDDLVLGGAGVDFLEVTLTETTDLKIESFLNIAQGFCQPNVSLILLSSDGQSVLAFNNFQGGCVLIDPVEDPGAQRLPAGTYFIRVSSLSSENVFYQLKLTAIASCGDGVLEGVEECDDANQQAGDGCSKLCTVEPACGNGIPDLGEACEDGNLISGDGCDAQCQPEPGHFFELEPNDDGSAASSVDDFSAFAANGPLGGSVLVHGALPTAGDEDIFAVQNNGAVAVAVRLETFGGAVGACSIDTTIAVRAANGAQIAFDDDRGVDSCSQLDVTVAAGQTVFVQISDFGDNDSIPGYLLQVTFL